MENASEDGFQIATLVVIVLTVLVVIAYLLIFINPRVALNPFKPPLDTTPTLAIAAVSTLPPTWTPTPTVTDTPTTTPTSTATPTMTPSPFPTPAPASATPPPAPRPAHTPAPAPPTLLPSPYSFQPTLISCTHSGSTQIKGKVTSGGGPIDGIHVRLATSNDPASVVEDQVVRRDSDSSTIYAFVMAAIGSLPSFNWYVYVADAQGNALSDPNYHIAMNNLQASDPNSCWLAVIDFSR